MPDRTPRQFRWGRFAGWGIGLTLLHVALLLLLSGREVVSDLPIVLLRVLSSPLYVLWKLLGKGGFPPIAATLGNSALWGFAIATFLGWSRRRNSN